MAIAQKVLLRSSVRVRSLPLKQTLSNNNNMTKEEYKAVADAFCKNSRCDKYLHCMANNKSCTDLASFLCDVRNSVTKKQ